MSHAGCGRIEIPSWGISSPAPALSTEALMASDRSRSPCFASKGRPDDRVAGTLRRRLPRSGRRPSAFVPQHRFGETEIGENAGSYLPVRSRCLHPGQQQGRRWPSSSSSWARRMRRSRVVSCLASSTQQMNSLRARGVMSFQAWSAVALAISAWRRSAGSLCTTPPGTRWLLTGATVADAVELADQAQLRAWCGCISPARARGACSGRAPWRRPRGANRAGAGAGRSGPR
jgi:hypothetical protein